MHTLLPRITLELGSVFDESLPSHGMVLSELGSDLGESSTRDALLSRPFFSDYYAVNRN